MPSLPSEARSQYRCVGMAHPGMGLCVHASHTMAAALVVPCAPPYILYLAGSHALAQTWTDKRKNEFKQGLLSAMGSALCTVLHCTVPQCTTLHCTVPQCTALCCTAPQRNLIWFVVQEESGIPQQTLLDKLPVSGIDMKPSEADWTSRLGICR